MKENNEMLLFDDNPVLINPTLAVLIGLNEAVILQQIHYWNTINKNKTNNYRDGYYWTYNTKKDWQKQLPWLSVSTIKRAIKNLEDKNLIVTTSKYNKLKIDQTKWYRINYTELENLKQKKDEVQANESSEEVDFEVPF